MVGGSEALDVLTEAVAERCGAADACGVARYDHELSGVAAARDVDRKARGVAGGRRCAFNRCEQEVAGVEQTGRLLLERFEVLGRWQGRAELRDAGLQLAEPVDELPGGRYATGKP